MPGLDRLWAGWRDAYIESFKIEKGPDGAVPSGSIFEQILASDLPDEEVFIVARGESCFVILNAYPYTSGHVLVMPYRSVPDIEGLTDDEYDELWRLVRSAVVAVKASYGCHGLNIGVNLGKAGGAGVPDHLHVHVLPRWGGDTNFMTSVAEARVMPEALRTTFERLKDAWPTS